MYYIYIYIYIYRKVSDITCINFKLCNTTEVKEATLVTQEINKR